MWWELVLLPVQPLAASGTCSPASPAAGRASPGTAPAPLLPCKHSCLLVPGDRQMDMPCFASSSWGALAGRGERPCPHFPARTPRSTHGQQLCSSVHSDIHFYGR